MILVASQRGGAEQLAAHLLNEVENDHVTLAETRGFMAGDLCGALDEADAISKAMRCKQFLFSLSLNPPKDGQATVADLMAAIDQAENRLGLRGQPRAIVDSVALPDLDRAALRDAGEMMLRGEANDAFVAYERAVMDRAAGGRPAGPRDDIPFDGAAVSSSTSRSLPGGDTAPAEATRRAREAYAAFSRQAKAMQLLQSCAAAAAELL